MDEALLARKGIIPGNVSPGYVDGFAIRIGERATLVQSTGARSYGVVMSISPDEVKELYSDSSVTDYVAEPVTVWRLDGSKVAADCYNLPVDELHGANEDYADSLLKLARRLGFPGSYLDQIRQAGS